MGLGDKEAKIDAEMTTKMTIETSRADTTFDPTESLIDNTMNTTNDNITETDPEEQVEGTVVDLMAPGLAHTMSLLGPLLSKACQITLLFAVKKPPTKIEK